ncbi:hypothetical protein QYE76_048762, partial [Lolium multiflorum]
SGHVKKKGIFDIHVINVYLTGSRSAWVFDTGSVAHICNSKQELRNRRSLARDEVTMRVGNGSKVDVIAVGTLPLHLPSRLVLNLNNCYLVPALSMNIISGSCLMQDGYSFKSENNGCSIYMSNVFYGHAPEMNGLFLLNLDSSDTHVHNIDAKRIKLNDNSTYMWHCRLGHIGVKRMKKLHSDGLLESLDFESLDRCEACLMGKMTKTPFSGTMERATDLLEIIHTDVCGPMSVASRGGYRYVLTFMDDLSRYGYIYFMKHKSETFEKFKEFQSEVENQRNKKIKFLRSDRGGEYLSYEFGMHLKKCGILSQLTPPGTPQRNGVSERHNRTLLDMVRSMMSLTDLPLSFWGYALETAAFTLNRAPSKSVETTPYELWFGKKPKLSFLKVWGCEAYVKKLQPDKLEPKAEKCVFIGYPKETIGYTFYHRSEGKIFVAKNGSFLEKEFLTKEVTGRKVELDEVDEPSLIDQSSAVPEEVSAQPTPIGEEANDDDHETSNEEATEPRRSTRERTTPDWYDPCLNVMIVDNNDEDPATYEEAMMSPDSNKWQEAMKSEMRSMYDNKVWTLVDLPDSRKAVENKWIFKRKTDADGNITVYKARLVAKGFRQIQGVDYDETFSPVAKLKSVRILLAIAAFFDYEIWQMDVKTAFLNGDIEEQLYMVQPKGFVDPKNATRVIKDFGFIRTHGEACIYKKVSGSSVAFLILYVDDILLIGNDIELLSSVKGYLNKSFSMKDLGEAAYILGIKIYRDRSRRLIGLSQSTYLDKILKKFRMDESKKGFLPMLPGKVLSKTQALPETSVKELTAQVSALKAEKEQLALEHRRALIAQETISAKLKDQLVQVEIRHAQELKDAQAAAEAKLDESLKEFSDASAQLRKELEEESRQLKEVRDRNAVLTTDQAEYDRLVIQADTLAFKLFPDLETHAHKKVAERRAEQSLGNPDAPWDAYDHLVALAARISHMRAVDRHLVELPERAMQIFKVLWPGEALPDTLTLLSDRLRDAGRRFREWQRSSARAGADAALRVACSWYEDLDLDALHSLRGDAPTDTVPALTAKRQDRAYRIAQCAPTSTFIPPPADLADEISDDEEDDDAGEEEEDAGESSALPEQAPEASEAGPQPPVA